ncbi:MAG: FTR1 family protein [Anaerolineales bacterium]|jgi:high-affinity iron transporter
MLPSYVLALREGLEAALIIGIVLGALKKIDRSEYNRFVWYGAGLAIAVSLVTALIFYSVGASFQGAAAEIFEGLMMLLAAGVLTWMIFWMQRQAHNLKHELEAGVHQAASKNSQGALFALAFFAVVREGVELALFLTAASFSSAAWQVIIGGLLGVGTAVVLGYLLFATTVRLNLRQFFNVTSILLIFFAAGLVAHGVHELIEASWIPAGIEQVWDTNPVLDEDSTLGLILKTLFGYNGNPALVEVIAYSSYLVIVGIAVWVRSLLLKASQRAENLAQIR